MSVKVSISENGVFDSPANIERSDLVFWHNGDTQPHYPIPGCESLRTAAGAQSQPYRPTPQPTLPVTTITYHCALHDAEEGTLVINNDITGTTTPTGTNGTGLVQIAISSGGAFQAVDLTQPDSVIWDNNDSQEHWPVPNCSGLRVEPGKSSNAMQPAPNPNVPLQVIYGCAIPGHEAEQGSMTIYAPMAVKTNPGAVSFAKQAAASVATGGKSPYTCVNDPAFDYLTLIETTPAGTSAGVSIIATKAPPAPGTITYQLNITDGMGRKLTAPITLTVS
jgi:hypothetical protein